MTDRPFKHLLYERLASVAKALASPRRIELLELVAQAERPVEWLADATGMTMGNTSQHLRVLRVAGLVEARKDGLFVYYRLATPAVAELYGTLRRVAEAQQAEIGRLASSWFADRRDLDAVTFAELEERLRDGEVVVIDVRPREEFEAAHIRGARSVPIATLPEVTDSLPRDRVVVAYCRGPYCVFADDAVHHLRKAGVDARRLEGGLPEWRAAGLPTSVGADR